MRRGRIPKEELAARKFLNHFWRELSRDFRGMMNWLLFYKPQGKFDKTLHVFEVFLFWSLLTTLYIRW
jgi:hypothetical protein